MKPYLLLSLLTVLFFSSCTTYKYITLSSDQLQKNDLHEFVWGNDTMTLVYNFRGQNGPMNITVFNKTNQPLFINWKKSSLIENSDAISLYNNKVEFSGSAIDINTRNAYARDFSGSFNLPEWVDFIPPQAHISKELISIIHKNLPDLPKDIKDEKAGIDGNMVTYKQKNFTDSLSPLQFRCYITFNLGNENSSEFSVQHSFYASNIRQSKHEAMDFTLYTMEGDRMYVKQTTDN